MVVSNWTASCRKARRSRSSLAKPTKVSKSMPTPNRSCCGRSSNASAAKPFRWPIFSVNFAHESERAASCRGQWTCSRAHSGRRSVVAHESAQGAERDPRGTRTSRCSCRCATRNRFARSECQVSRRSPNPFGANSISSLLSRQRSAEANRDSGLLAREPWKPTADLRTPNMRWSRRHDVNRFAPRLIANV